MSAMPTGRQARRPVNLKRNMNLKRSARSAFLLMLLTTASLTGFTQDSLRLVPVRAWQLSRMIEDVRAGRVCDTLVQKQALALSSADSVIQNLDTQVKLLNSQIKTYSQISNSWQRSYGMLQMQAKEDRKNARKQGMKEGAAATLLIVLVGIAVF